MDAGNDPGGDLLIDMVIGALRAAALRDDRGRRFVLARLERLRAELEAAGASEGAPANVQPTQREGVESVAALAAGVMEAPQPVPATQPLSPQPPAPVQPIVSTVLRLGDETRPVSVRGSSAEADAAARAAAASPPRVEDPAGRAFDVGEQSALSPLIVAERAALKADACRWAASDPHRLAAGDDGAVEYRALITRAKALPACHLWMVDPKLRWMRPSERELSTLAGCFDALADACRLVADPSLISTGAAEPGRMLWLLAEAQSALRAAVVAAAVDIADTDQKDAFNWLKQETSGRGIYIDRHMRLDDPADPENAADLRERIATVRRERSELESRRKSRSSRINKVRYHSGRVLQHLQSVAPAGTDDARDEWLRLATAIEQAVGEDGLPPSDPQLRDAVRPVLAAKPQEPFGPGVEAVLEAIDSYESSLDSAEAVDAEDASEATVTADVRRAAELLRGSRVVLIGGLPRPHGKRKLERALELDELVWLSSRVHQSFYDFGPAVAREETSVVLLAIRWSSHGFAEVKELCERYGKPLVRLPGGYNPEQVAVQILQQAGKQLEGRRWGSVATPAPLG